MSYYTRKKNSMKNSLIDENIFKADDINLLNVNEKLLNTPCVLIQNIDYTPLQASIIYNSIKIRNFILEQNNIDINIQNSKGENALTTAIINKAPITFVKELIRRNIDVCLPKDTKYSNIMDLADPEWEGYSELKHIFERRKSYNFIYKKQNSEKQADNQFKDIKKGIESSDYFIDLTKLGNEQAEAQKKSNDLNDNLLNINTTKSMNFNQKDLNFSTNNLQTVKDKNTQESIGQMVSKRNPNRTISKSIFIPKDVIKPSLQFSSNHIKKEVDQIENNIQEIISKSHESDILFNISETENKSKEFKGNVDSSQNMALNVEEEEAMNNNEIRSDKNNSGLIPEKNTEPEQITKKIIKDEYYHVDKGDQSYNRYIGIDDEYMLLIGYQLNESIEASKKLFTCTCCALTRPWKSETEQN